MIAYLSGGMENAIDEGADWRNDITIWLRDNLGHSVINPVLESQKMVKEHNAQAYRTWKKNDPKKFKKFIRLLIDHDIKSVISHADYLIVLWDSSVLKGGGTHGEVTLAYWTGKPIFLVNKVPADDFSAWISSCSSKIFLSLNLSFLIPLISIISITFAFLLIDLRGFSRKLSISSPTQKIISAFSIALALLGLRLKLCGELDPSTIIDGLPTPSIT